MSKELEIEFKTLLTKEEYVKLCTKFQDCKRNLQINYYFDTSRFTLKASDIGLRVRMLDKDKYVITLKKKKGYTIQQFTQPITAEEFAMIKETGTLPEGEIANEIPSIIGTQKVNNFMSLTTNRVYMPYSNGILFIDKSSYLGVSDFELVYEAKNYHDGKKEFVQLIGELQIQYKKSEKKVKRAFNAYKRSH